MKLPLLIPFILVLQAIFAAQALDEPPAALPPMVESTIPPEGARIRELSSVEVLFNVPVDGVDPADLLINGSPASDLTEFGPGRYVFTFQQPPDGPITVLWRSDHGIVDTASGTYSLAGGTWVYELDASHPPPEVVISEFMADNDRALRDEDGDNSDWIEIFNGSDGFVSLEGWFLTDDRTNLTKWRLPEVILDAREFLVVLASEKNRTTLPGRLHTNFRLSATGEYLALVSARTNIVSEFAPTYPEQRTDVSYGRAPGAGDAIGYFARPTPGAANAESGSGFAPAVSFSRGGGVFMEPFELRLSASDSRAVLRYTLNGALPTNSSPVYLRPIPITNSVQVRVRAFQDGLLPGPPRSESFLMLSSNVTSFTSDLPVIVIHSLGQGAPSATRQNFAQIAVFEPDEGITSLTNPPTLLSRSGIKLRGSSTQGLSKSSFALEFWDEFNLDQRRSLLGLPEDADWVLYAPNTFDPVLIHNPFIHQLSRDLGRYSSRTRFVEVYLNRSNGPIIALNYNGIYVLEEKIKISPHRVAIDKLRPEHVQAPEVTGGYLLKIDRLDPGDSGFTAGGQSMAYVDPKEREIRTAQRDPQEQYIRNYFAAFNRALSSTNWQDPEKGYAAYIDVESWIDFHVLEVLSGNVDAIVLSTYFHKPRGGKIIFGPHWDFDRALGSTDGRDANPRRWTTGPFFTSWWSRLFRDPAFWQKWIDRYQELRQSHFSRTNINQVIDQLANEVRQAQPRERQKWRIPLRGGSYQGEVNLMKNWLSNRLDYIDRQLVQPPVFSASGGRVTPGFLLELQGPTNATVYYTTDGTDPRVSQGGVAPHARAYTDPIQIDNNAHVVARAHNLAQRQTGGPPISSPWSSPVGATFTVRPPALLLTELMFHPEALAQPNAPAEVEFLELKNISSEPVHLAGYRFTRGISFTFTSTNSAPSLAPGERVVLVSSLTAFRTRYPGVNSVAGEFVGTLDNAGEALTLVGPVGEPVFDLTYNDTWEPLADGFGFALVLREENAGAEELSNPGRWRLSAYPGGSPGQPDPEPALVPRVFINEVLTNPEASATDQLELFNPNEAPADVGGWFLTDDYRTPRKYRLPVGAIVPGEGYATLQALGVPSVAFSKLGEEVYLFSANSAGELTGWLHGFEFGASEPGASFGRWLNSAGQETFVLQRSATFGTANTGPRTNPVVISEVLFAPEASEATAGNEFQYIELVNASSQPVALFDPAYPQHTWRVRGTVDFNFPPAQTLQANGYVVIVGFDPQNSPATLSRFQSHYALDAVENVLGPWQGVLDRTHGVVRLLRPGAPEPVIAPNDEVTVPQIPVEELQYSSGSNTSVNEQPPAGAALVRLDMAVYAGEPTNWIWAEPNPGDADSDGDALPERWEWHYGFSPHSASGEDGPEGDPDGDGFDNWQEFRSGTDPRNPESALKLIPTMREDGARVLTFRTVPGRRYLIESSGSLAENSWQILHRVISGPEATQAFVADTTPGEQRYYRITIP